MPLSGIRVLDLSGVAGTLGGRLLAGLGARVLRPQTCIAATEQRFGPAGRLYYEASGPPSAFAPWRCPLQDCASSRRPSNLSRNSTQNSRRRRGRSSH